MNETLTSLWGLLSIPLAWLGTHDAVLAVSIAVLGWIVTHALSLRAQRTLLRHQILDRARIDVTVAIREAQEWLSKVYGSAVGVRINVSLEARGLPADFQPNYERLATLIGDSQLNSWNLRLEEHIILFPECADLREIMQEREVALFSEISHYATDLLATLGAPDGSARRAALADAAQAGWMSRHFHEVGLLEDLRIHVQSATLKVLTGRRVKERRPLDPRVPRLRRGKGGMLEIQSS